MKSHDSTEIPRRDDFPEQEFTWDEVMKCSDDTLYKLIRDGFSYQDIYHIGARLMLAGQSLFVKGYQTFDSVDEPIDTETVDEDEIEKIRERLLKERNVSALQEIEDTKKLRDIIRTLMRDEIVHDIIRCDEKLYKRVDDFSREERSQKQKREFRW